MLLYGKEIRENIKKRVKKSAAEKVMSLTVVQVGEDPASASYVRSISRFALEVGVKFDLITMLADVEEKELIAKIESLNEDQEVTGIMIQLPLPAHLNTDKIINCMNPDKDVEGIHNINMGKLLAKQASVKPSTPKAVVNMLKSNNIELEGEKVTIVGRSNEVGSPLSVMMTAENATVTLCHSRTRDIAAETKNADILIVAVGKKNFIKSEMVKDNGVIIDVGTNFDENGKMIGDVEEKAKAKACYASAVPGGVGVITVAELFDNLRILSEERSL